MTWIESHRESEHLASEAHEAMRRGDEALAKQRFAAAAQAETEALGKVGAEKPRTLGIIAVSAVALWFKAGRKREAELLARRAAGMEGMPAFAREQLHEFLQDDSPELETDAAGGALVYQGETLA